MTIHEWLKHRGACRLDREKVLQLGARLSTVRRRLETLDPRTRRILCGAATPSLYLARMNVRSMRWWATYSLVGVDGVLPDRPFTLERIGRRLRARGVK